MKALGTRFIEELLALVDRGKADQTLRLTEDRERLEREVRNLIQLVASGVSAETLAADIKQREREIAEGRRPAKAPRAQQPDIERLRDALHQRAAQWKSDLRSEPQVARTLLRRLVGPLTLWDASEPDSAFVEWETNVMPAILEGLAPIQVVASLTAPAWNQIAAFLESIQRLRDSPGFAA